VAVVRFTTVSNLVGACTGRSDDFFPLEDAIDVASRQPIWLGLIDTKRDQAVGGNETSERIYRGPAVPRGERDNLIAVTIRPPYISRAKVVIPRPISSASRRPNGVTRRPTGCVHRRPTCLKGHVVVGQRVRGDSQGPLGRPRKRGRERSSCPRIPARSGIALAPALDTVPQLAPILEIAPRRVASRCRAKAPLTTRPKACSRSSMFSLLWVSALVQVTIDTKRNSLGSPWHQRARLPLARGHTWRLPPQRRSSPHPSKERYQVRSLLRGCRDGLRLLSPCRRSSSSV
jgi:hypothetical protein